MPLKKSQGNMYDWVTHTHSHLGGECPHSCSYCYVQNNRFGVSERYKGQPRLLSYELDVDYGSGKIIFIEHMSDMFAKGIPNEWIEKILEHCNKYHHNHYVFQTKNPYRAWLWLSKFPPKFMIGTTIESNREYPYITDAPIPIKRYEGIKLFKGNDIFVTIEPIMDFDVDILTEWIYEIKPKFVNIGADSKNCNLPEPSSDKIREFIHKLQTNGITIKKKINLSRLLNR